MARFASPTNLNNAGFGALGASQHERKSFLYFSYFLPAFIDFKKKPARYLRPFRRVDGRGENLGLFCVGPPQVRWTPGRQTRDGLGPRTTGHEHKRAFLISPGRVAIITGGLRWIRTPDGRGPRGEWGRQIFVLCRRAKKERLPRGRGRNCENLGRTDAGARLWT